MAVNLKIVSQVVASGTPGPAGKSAYQIAVDNGFEGTESEWLKELHPFKGWFDSVSELEEEHSAPSVGEYAYVKGATSSDPVKIYECSTEGTWSDSGRTVDTSTVQTFRSGEEVNDVGIDDEPTAGSDNLVKSNGVAKDIVETPHLGSVKIDLIETKNGYIYYTNVWKDSTTYTSKLLAVTKEYCYKIFANTESNSYYTLLSELPTFVQGDPVNYATGYSGTVELSQGTNILLDIPNDAKYLYVVHNNGSSMATPSAIELSINAKKNPEYGSRDVVESNGIFNYVQQNKILGDIFLQSYENKSGFINNYGKWIDSAAISSKLIPIIVTGSIIKIKANSGGSVSFALLSELPSFIEGDSVSFADGYSAVNAISTSEDILVNVPKNAAYLYIVNYDGSTDRLPSSVKFIQDDTTLIPHLGMVELQSINDYQGYISTSGKWTTSYTSLAKIIPIVKGSICKIKANDNYPTHYCFLAEIPTFISGSYVEMADGYNTTAIIPEGQSSEILVPLNAKYLYLLNANDNVIYLPNNVETYITFKNSDSEIDLTSLTKENGYLSVNNNTWSANNTVQSCIIPVKKNYAYKIELSAAASGGVLAGNNPSTNLIFATGESAQNFPAGEPVIYPPSDATCICVVYSINSGQDVLLNGVHEYAMSLLAPSLCNSINGFRLNETNRDIIINSFSAQNKVVSDGSVESDSDYKSSDYISTLNFKKMKISLPRTTESSSDCGIAFYDQNKKFIKGSFSASFTDKDASNNYVEDINVYIPENAYYFRTTMWSDEFATTNSIDNLVKYSFYPDSESNHITKHYVPNEFVENVIKRARAFANVRWTPVDELPRCCTLVQENSNPTAFSQGTYIDKFKPYVEHIGVPYSFAGRNDMGGNPLAAAFGRFALEVGHDVPFEAFVTAARNPNSFLYDKAIYEAQPFERTLSCIPFGADCVGMASYAMGWAFSSSISERFRDDSLTDVIGEPQSMDLSQIMPADFLVCSFHTALITDVYYENGILMIEVGEENTEGGATNTPFYSGLSGGRSYRKLYTADEFRNYYKRYDSDNSKNYKIRRLKNFAKYETEYVPDIFAPIEDFPRRLPVVDYACMPYMGNGFIFKQGYIPQYAQKILINAKGFVKLSVYKDDVLQNEYIIDDNTEYVDVAFSAVGTYTAKVFTSSGFYTKACTWYVE